MAINSTRKYARGQFAKLTTTATTEVAVLTYTQGDSGGNGFSILVSGSGAGVVSLYFVDAEENAVLTDTITTASKVANKLLFINYGGRIPKVLIKVTPSTVASQEWLVEGCGVQ